MTITTTVSPKVAISVTLIIIRNKEERDLGILIDKSLKHGKHISTCVKKANIMIGTMKRKLVYREQHSMTFFVYKSLVKPHLEYCVQRWNPCQLGHVRLKECKEVSQNSYQDGRATI